MENEYLNRLNTIVTKNEEIAPSALREILKKLFNGDRVVQKNISNSDYLRTHISLKEGHPRITAAQLKNHTKRNVIDALSQSVDHRFRAAIVYRHLSGFDKPDNELLLEDLNINLNRIINEANFPHPQPENPLKEGKEDDYKTASLIFNPGRRSSKETLMFTIAVLGIDLDFLADFLTSFQPFREKTKFKLGYKFLISLAVLTFCFFVLYRYWGSEKNTSKKLFFQVHSTELFGKKYLPIAADIPAADSISLEVIQVVSDQFILKNDSVPLNEVWIRLMLSNYSESLEFYPDGLFYLPVLQGHLSGRLMNRSKKYRTDATMSINLPTALNRVFEWEIKNGETPYFLPPRKRAFIFFRLTGDNDSLEGIYTFQFALEGFDQRKNTLDAETAQIKLAIN